MNIQAIIEDYELVFYSAAPIDRYIRRVIRALNKCDATGQSPLAEDLEGFDESDKTCRETLQEAIEWLKRHGKKE
jgi:hypothetical protein